MLVTSSIEELVQIHVLGRTLVKDGALHVFWSGSGIVFNFQGSFLSFRYQSDYETFEPWISILIDQKWKYRVPTEKGLHDFNVFLNEDPDVVHRVEILKDTQAMPSDQKHMLIINSLSYIGEISSPESYSLKIEFIGDSITSGEGTVGEIGDMEWIPKNFSFVPTYARYTADNLNADYRVISQSGWGIHSSWNNNIYETLPSVYNEICMISETGNVPYNFSEWQPDVVVINLGTNDEGAFHQPPFIHPETGEPFQHRLRKDGSYHPEDIKDIRKAQIQFLADIRKRYPDTIIIWCYGMIGYPFSEVLQKGVEQYKAEYEDKNAYYLKLPEMTEDTVGSRMHPGPACHKSASEVLTSFIKETQIKQESQSDSGILQMQREVSHLNFLFVKMNVLAYVMLFAGAFIVMFLLMRAGLLGHNPLSMFGSKYYLYGSIIINYLLMFGIIFLDRRKSFSDDIHHFDFRRLKLSSLFLLFILGVLTRAISDYILQIIGIFINVSARPTTFALFPFVVTSIVGPICEELLMRGFFFSQYKKYLSIRKAILVSAFLFGIMHLNYIQFWFALITGIFFAIAVESTGSIYSAMILHIIHNASTELNIQYRLHAYPFIRNLYRILYQISGSQKAYDINLFIVRTVLFLLSCIVAYIILKILAQNEGYKDHFDAIFSKKAEKTANDEVQVIDAWFIVLLVVFSIFMVWITKALFIR